MWLIDKLLGYQADPDNYADVLTRFGRAQVYDTQTEEGDILRVLDVAGTWQSASYVDGRWAELAFGYHRLFDQAFVAHPHIGRVLALGGGALSYPKHLVATRADLAVDVAEIDPQVIELATTWFFLDRLDAGQHARLYVHCADALAFLSDRAADAEAPRYDYVVNDLFAAEKPTARLMTADGLRLVQGVLAPDGLYATNVVSALKGRKARPLQQVQEALGSVFAQVVTVPLGSDEPREPDNNVVFATNGSYSLKGLVSPTSC